MSREQRLFSALQAFQPSELFIENESFRHGFSRGEDSHFKILIVSEDFAGLSRVERHQKVNAVLKEEFDLGMHAATLRAVTPEEFSKMDPSEFKSPACAHNK